MGLVWSLILQQVGLDLFKQRLQISKSVSRSKQSPLGTLRISTTSHATYSISQSKSQSSAQLRGRKEAPPLESCQKEYGYGRSRQLGHFAISLSEDGHHSQPSFTDESSKAQRGAVTCSRSHSYEKAEVRFKAMSAPFSMTAAF